VEALPLGVSQITHGKSVQHVHILPRVSTSSEVDYHHGQKHEGQKAESGDESFDKPEICLNAVAKEVKRVFVLLMVFFIFLINLLLKLVLTSGFEILLHDPILAHLVFFKYLLAVFQRIGSEVLFVESSDYLVKCFRLHIYIFYLWWWQLEQTSKLELALALILRFLKPDLEEGLDCLQMVVR